MNGNWRSSNCSRWIAGNNVCTCISPAQNPFLARYRPTLCNITMSLPLCGFLVTVRRSVWCCLRILVSCQEGTHNKDDNFSWHPILELRRPGLVSYKKYLLDLYGEQRTLTFAARLRGLYIVGQATTRTPSHGLMHQSHQGNVHVSVHVRLNSRILWNICTPTSPFTRPPGKLWVPSEYKDRNINTSPYTYVNRGFNIRMWRPKMLIP